jgi:hypothetical protein
MPSALSKTLARLKSRGIKEVGAETWRHVSEWAYSNEELIFLARPAGPGSAGVHAEKGRAAGLTLHEATPADGPDYEKWIGTDSATTFAARLTDGTKCWIVRKDGRVLHGTWTSTEPAWTREIRRYFVPPPGAAYVYESFTRADARGLGVYPFALESLAEELGRRGIERLLVGVEGGNVPSQRAIAKAGFEPVFTIRYGRRAGFLRLRGATGAAPELARRVLLRVGPDQKGGMQAQRGKR